MEKTNVEVVINGKKYDLNELEGKVKTFEYIKEYAAILRNELVKLPTTVKYREIKRAKNEKMGELISIFAEISDSADTLVYYAKCGCCDVEQWTDDILGAGVKKVIFISEYPVFRSDFPDNEELLENLRANGISIREVSMNQRT